MHTANDISKSCEQTWLISEWIIYEPEFWFWITTTIHTELLVHYVKLHDDIYPNTLSQAGFTYGIYQCLEVWFQLLITAPLLKVSIATVIFPEALLYLTHFNGTFLFISHVQNEEIFLQAYQRTESQILYWKPKDSLTRA